MVVVGAHVAMLRSTPGLVHESLLAVLEAPLQCWGIEPGSPTYAQPFVLFMALAMTLKNLKT